MKMCSWHFQRFVFSSVISKCSQYKVLNFHTRYCASCSARTNRHHRMIVLHLNWTQMNSSKRCTCRAKHRPRFCFVCLMSIWTVSRPMSRGCWKHPINRKEVRAISICLHHCACVSYANECVFVWFFFFFYFSFFVRLFTQDAFQKFTVG